MKSNDILEKAIEIVDGDRQEKYGDKGETHDKIAKLWEVWLKIRKPGPLDRTDVATMMALMKVVRSTCGSYNEDDYVDMVAYMSFAGEFEQKSKRDEGYGGMHTNGVITSLDKDLFTQNYCTKVSMYDCKVG